MCSGGPSLTPIEWANAASRHSAGVKRSSCSDRPRMRSTEERAHLAVLGHEALQVHAARRVDQPVRLDHVLLLAAARHREVFHRRAPVVERRVEQLRDVLALGLDRSPASGRGDAPFAWITSGSRSRNWRMPGVQRGRRACRTPTRRPAGTASRRGTSTSVRLKYERAQLREREAGVVEPPERLGFERPVALAVDQLVEQREPGRLQRFEVAADRPRRDAGPRRPDRRSSAGATLRGRAGSTTAG